LLRILRNAPTREGKILLMAVDIFPTFTREDTNGHDITF